MNKSEIKTFAIWARNKLIADSVYKASLLGITENGIQNPLPQSTSDAQLFDIGMKEPYAITGQEIDQRRKLVAAIKNKQRDLKYKDAFQNVMEEAAYTWFNRLIAIRFMEVNDYMPSHIRVLSSENPGKTEPDLVTTPFDSDLQFKDEEKQQIIDLKNENKTDDVFRMLFIKQCNALNESLPMLFEKISDYTELLLNISITDRDGIVWHLVHDIPENNFDVNAVDEDGKPMGQVEIIGWLYQYYNTEPKDKVFANLKKNIKITKETIPAATQLFTPDWIVRYMVENSLGRLWIEGHPNDYLKASWKYYLDEAEQEADVQKQLDQIYAEHAKLKPEEITCIDPCCGSGHILVYMFEVLMQIYQSQGYSAREAAVSIVEHNIYGLDIDKRAAQLAYFAVMMKARQYDRRFLTRGIQPNVFAICESNRISEDCLQYFANGDEQLDKEIHTLVGEMKDACEYGSMLQISAINFNLIDVRLKEIHNDINFYRQEVEEYLIPVVNVARSFFQKYDIAVTNPPYMNSGSMNTKLSDYCKSKYSDARYDLFSVFVIRCGQMLKQHGLEALITQQGWMYLSTYKKFRTNLFRSGIVSLVQLGARAFDDINGEIVQTVSFVLRKEHTENYIGAYSRLIEYSTPDEKKCGYLAHSNLYYKKQEIFNAIPDFPVAYWVSDRFINNFNYRKLGEISRPRSGMSTNNNNRFLRIWNEVEFNFVNLRCKNIGDVQHATEKWYPYNKGGQSKKWYGNYDYIVNWENDGEEIKYFATHNPKDPNTKQWTRRISNYQLYFQRAITWSLTNGGHFAARLRIAGSIFDMNGMSLFCDHDIEKYILALMCSNTVDYYMNVFNPTLANQAGDIAKIPFIFANRIKAKVDNLCDECIKIAKFDWDSFEVSWDFLRHPLCPSAIDTYDQSHSQFAADRMSKFGRISWHYDNWKRECEERFRKLKANEEELNRIFIDIYGLQDELTPEEDDKDVTVRLADLNSDIRSFISYAVGCMFGRYSLDVDGLAYAGGDWDDSKYKTFLPDADNVIPITDEEYLDDDIVGRFVQFVKGVYGEKTLEENLTFIADALGGKGKSSREVIRNYFLKDFFKDHCKTYQKRPIYWLYDSGKQNGFKALVYLHRMDENTTGKVRADYLHRMEQIYGNEVIRMQDVIDHDKSAHQVSLAEKRMDKLKKQIKECQDYDAKLGHLALDQIKLNLDDGVKVNYRKTQTGRDGKFYEVLADSKNIMANDALWKEYLTEWPHEEE